MLLGQCKTAKVLHGFQHLRAICTIITVYNRIYLRSRNSDRVYCSFYLLTRCQPQFDICQPKGGPHSGLILCTSLERPVKTLIGQQRISYLGLGSSPPLWIILSDSTIMMDAGYDLTCLFWRILRHTNTCMTPTNMYVSGLAWSKSEYWGSEHEYDPLLPRHC